MYQFKNFTHPFKTQQMGAEKFQSPKVEVTLVECLDFLNFSHLHD